MSNYILTRIAAIQQELELLKEKVIVQEQRDRLDHSEGSFPKVELRGIWKGVEISDELLEEAKQSLGSKNYRAKP